jgi:hypothetical protein
MEARDDFRYPSQPFVNLRRFRPEATLARWRRSLRRYLLEKFIDVAGIGSLHGLGWDLNRLPIMPAIPPIAEIVLFTTLSLPIEP